MNKKLNIKSVMHPFPHTISPSQTLHVAKNMLNEHNIRHLPVKEGADLVGILTDRDIEFALRVEKKDPEEMLVRDAYMPDPYVVAMDEPIDKVARQMAHYHYGCALVVENDRLVGIFTTVDACRTLAETLSGQAEQ